MSDRLAALPAARAAGEPPATPLWTEETVRERLADALTTLRRWRLPPHAFPGRVRSTMPEPLREAGDAPPDSDLTDRTPPSAKAIQRMEETLPWLYWIDEPRRRKAVCLRAMGVSWRRVAAAISVASPETARAWEAAAIRDIARRLNATGR